MQNILKKMEEKSQREITALEAHKELEIVSFFRFFSFFFRQKKAVFNELKARKISDAVFFIKFTSFRKQFKQVSKQELISDELTHL